MPDGEKLKEAVLELIKKCATDLPPDIVRGLKEGQEREEKGSLGYNVFTTLLDDVEVARQNTAPLCQDTGTPLFFVDYPPSWRQKEIEEAILWALPEATKNAYLRPNAVDPITGKNSGNNIGEGFPVMHFHQWDQVRWIPKVGANDALTMLCLLCNLGDTNHRGVAAQDSLPWAQTVQVGKNLLFQFQVLKDSLDHVVTVLTGCCQVVRCADVIENPVNVPAKINSMLCHIGEVGAHAIFGRVENLRVVFDQPHGMSMGGENLGNAMPH